MSRRDSKRRSTVGSSTMVDVAAGALGIATPATSSGLQRRGSQRGSFVVEGIGESIGLGIGQPASHLRRRSSTVDNLGGQNSSLVDTGVEALFSKGITESACCRPCARTSLGEFLINPADHATRHRRKTENADEDDSQVVVGNWGNTRRFGLKDWFQAGFSLVPPGEAQLPDRTIMLILNLQVAVHRKTSVERYCYTVQKSKIPQGVGPAEIKTMVRQLLRCNHINILRCLEGLEDENMVYLLYEYWPCMTLMTVLDDANWTESDMANMARECSAAVAYAHSMNMSHLGFSLYHILLPSTGNAKPLKVFGFGLAGVFTVESGDKQFWSPESAEKFVQFGGNHLVKLEQAQKWSSDSWSLGVVVFSIIARRPPVIGGPDNIMQKVMRREWAFSPAFDDYDVEAKSMIEALLDPVHEKRLRPDRAHQHEWIRKRKGNPHQRIVEAAYKSLHAFCESPKAKKLFGRFLVRFLSAEQRREIAVRFATLDSKGDGFIDKVELENAAHQAQMSKNSVNVIANWFDVGTMPEKCISLSQFCETLAEEVIDGRALRHAFESLDEDGSEEITAEELHDALKVLDESLTLEEVQAHVDAAELDANAGKREDEKDDNASDNALDFGEFVRLFPVRMQRLAAFQARMQSAETETEALAKKFERVEDPVNKWIKDLEAYVEEMSELSQKAIDRKEEGMTVCKNLKKYLGKIQDCLRKPPGDSNFNIAEKLIEANNRNKYRARSRKSLKKGEDDSELDRFGFDNFLQVQSVLDNWQSCVVDEGKLLKQAMLAGQGMGKGEEVDRFKAYDASESAVGKAREIAKWAKHQTDEYKSLSDAMTTIETPMPVVSMSGRGLRQLASDEDNHDADMGEDQGRSEKNAISRFIDDVKRKGEVLSKQMMGSCSSS